MNQFPMDIESLYPLVTESIRRAEMLEDLGAPGAASAHLDVSFIEEKIADSLPASNPEGAIARRGAVRAALAAKEFSRAQSLVARFTAESSTAAELKKELASLFEEEDKITDGRNLSLYPRASKRYGIAEIRRVTRAWLQQGEPFPIG
jgi:hypothetical protein